MQLHFAYRVLKEVRNLSFYLALNTGLQGESLTTFHHIISSGPLPPESKGSVVLTLPGLSLRPGDFGLYACLANAEGSLFYDVADDNVSLPWLSVSARDADPLLLRGAVSLPHTFDTT